VQSQAQPQGDAGASGAGPGPVSGFVVDDPTTLVYDDETEALLVANAERLARDFPHMGTAAQAEEMLRVLLAAELITRTHTEQAEHFIDTLNQVLLDPEKGYLATRVEVPDLPTSITRKGTTPMRENRQARRQRRRKS
jgi:hypothetical protein